MSNIVLIGMPGSGKSTIGVLLAKRLAKRFVDTDIEIQQTTGESLQSTLDKQGYQALRQIEEQVLSRLFVDNCVIATGGSAVYSHSAMLHLKSQEAMIVFLDVAEEDLLNRIHDFDSRGIAGEPDQSFSDLFRERRPLYLRYADHIVNISDIGVEESVDKIASLCQS